MKFRYDLVGAGWAECHIEFGGHEATVTASYLSDALDSLCAAVVALLRGEPGATASFAEEPGEYRWTFKRVGQDRVRVSILELRESLSRQPEDRGRVVFDAEGRLRTLADAVLSELQRLDREYGEAGYRERWQLHDFPRKRLSQLQQILAG